MEAESYTRRFGRRRLQHDAASSRADGGLPLRGEEGPRAGSGECFGVGELADGSVLDSSSSSRRAKPLLLIGHEQRAGACACYCWAEVDGAEKESGSRQAAGRCSDDARGSSSSGPQVRRKVLAAGNMPAILACSRQRKGSFLVGARRLYSQRQQEVSPAPKKRTATKKTGR